MLLVLELLISCRSFWAFRIWFKCRLILVPLKKVEFSSVFGFAWLKTRLRIYVINHLTSLLKSVKSGNDLVRSSRLLPPQKGKGSRTTFILAAFPDYSIMGACFITLQIVLVCSFGEMEYFGFRCHRQKVNPFFPF